MDYEATMTPEKVDQLLDKEMGIANPEVREATKKYCLKMLDIGNVSVGDVDVSASAFAEGYEACLKKHS